MRSVVPLLCFISSITKRLSHKLSHPLKGQGASVFLYLLPPFSFQLVPHSSNGEFPRGTGVLLSPFPSIYPSLAPRDRCGVYWPCSDLLTWGGGHCPFFYSCTYSSAFHLLQPHLPLRREFVFRGDKQR